MGKPIDANWDDVGPAEVPLDRAITKALYRKWRAPRFGQANPERINNPVWEWLIRSRATAYGIAQRMHAPSALEAGPGWCFARNGQSETTLPDGRRIFIGGEHEDCYDPDFYIYNDVVVLHLDRRIDIYGYPPPTFIPLLWSGIKSTLLGASATPNSAKRSWHLFSVWIPGAWLYQLSRLQAPPRAASTNIPPSLLKTARRSLSAEAA